MYHSPHVRKMILTNTFPKDSTGEAVQCVLGAIHLAHNPQIKPEARSQRWISLDEAIVRMVRILHRESRGLFMPGEQYDLCELWVWLLDRLHQDIALPATIPPNTPPTTHQVLQTLLKFQGGKNSAILDGTQGSQIAMVKCTECDFHVTNIEPLTVINVDVPSTAPSNLADLIMRNFQPEPLEGWKCDKCGKVGGERKMRFFHLPSTIVVALNRFGSHGKKNVPVTIPDELVFSNAVVAGASAHLRYVLTAVGNHFGSCKGGHYTATVWEKERWVHVDDDQTAPCGERTFENNVEGYLMFFSLVPTAPQGT